MEVEQKSVFRIEVMDVRRFGNLMRVPQKRCPKVMFKWQPLGTSKSKKRKTSQEME